MEELKKKIREDVIDEFRTQYVSPADYMSIIRNLGPLVKYGRLMESAEHIKIQTPQGPMNVAKSLPEGFVIKTATLIKTREKHVEELKHELQEVRDKNNRIYLMLEELRAENKRLEEALDYHENENKKSWFKKLFK